MEERTPSTSRSGEGRSAGLGWVIGGLVVLLIVLIALTVYAVTRGRFVNDRQSIPFLGGGQATTQEVNVTLNDVTMQPRRYIGTVVTVQGQVGTIVSPRVFTLRQQSMLNTDSALVVIPPNLATSMNAVTELRPQQPVQVTGMVELYQPSVLQSLNVNLSGPIWMDNASHPLFVASLIQAPGAVAPGTAGATTNAPLAGAGTALGVAPGAAVGAGTNVGANTGGVPGNGPGVVPGAGAGAGAGVGVVSGAGVGAGNALGSSAINPAVAASSVSIETLRANPSAYTGRSISVTGEVQQLLSPQAVLVRDLNPIQGRSLLAISAQPLPASVAGISGPNPIVPQHNIVTLVGTLQPFTAANAQQLFGAQAAQYGQYVGGPVLVVQQVMQTEPLNVITARPQSFASSAVTTSGVVEIRFGNNAFSMRDVDPTQGADILVVSRQPTINPAVAVGNQVQVTGQIWTGDLASLQRQLGTTIDPRAIAGYGGRPVLVASSVTNNVPGSAGAAGTAGGAIGANAVGGVAPANGAAPVPGSVPAGNTAGGLGAEGTIGTLGATSGTR